MTSRPSRIESLFAVESSLILQARWCIFLDICVLIACLQICRIGIGYVRQVCRRIAPLDPWVCAECIEPAVKLCSSNDSLAALCKIGFDVERIAEAAFVNQICMPTTDGTEMVVALAGCALGYRISNGSVRRIVCTTPRKRYIVRNVLIVRCICVVDVVRKCVWSTTTRR